MLLASEIDVGSRKGWDSVGFHRKEGASGFWPQGERTGNSPNTQEFVVASSAGLAKSRRKESK